MHTSATLEAIFFVVALFLGIKCDAQCLKSVRAVTHNPNFTNGDVEWNTLSSGVYTTTLVYDAHTLRISQGEASTAYVDITARYHNGTFPSPTLRFKRGNQYRITLINRLGPESSSNPTEDNVFKDPNTTNMHS